MIASPVEPSAIGEVRPLGDGRVLILKDVGRSASKSWIGTRSTGSSKSMAGVADVPTLGCSEGTLGGSGKCNPLTFNIFKASAFAASG